MSVSMSGDYAIIGAPRDNNNGATTGAAYIFYNNSGIWQQQAKLVANDGAADDWFGVSVCIDGNYAVVGAVEDDDNGDCSGSAYIFYNNSGIWQQQAKLLADDGEENENFGYSVCIEGNYAIVGAMYDDDLFMLSGSAYIFFNNSGTWQQQAKINTDDRTGGEIFFGRSVDLSGDYAIIGCGGDPILDTYSAYAYIFYNNSGVWEQQAKLIGDDVEKWGGFGKSVSISGDYAIVASDHDNGDTGSAYIFYNNSGTWQQQAKLFASDGLPGDKFGRSVNISGDYAIVGSWSGSTYLYFNNSGTWQQKAKLLTDDGGLFPGWSVSISGNYGIVSNPWSGTAYVFSSVIAPTNLSSSNFSATSAKLSWTENGTATSWEIMLVPSGSDTSGVTPVSVNENPYTWDGLTPETEYDWYIRADCRDNDYSEWIGPSSFKTLGEGILWSNCYGGSARDKASAMTATTDGGYVVSGFTWSNNGDVTGNHGGYDFG